MDLILWRHADAAEGGYVVNTAALQSVNLGDTVKASLQGYGGFEPYTGPGFSRRHAKANAPLKYSTARSVVPASACTSPSSNRILSRVAS